MATIFGNPLVLAQTAVGSIIDQRHVIMYEQPDGDFEQAISAANLAGGTETIEESVRSTLAYLIKSNSLKELFTGSTITYLSDINGYNAFGISYLSAEANITSDLCEHPIETGTVVTDTAIINPMTATVRLSMPTAFYTRIYDQIYKYFTTKKKIMLQTKFAVYTDLVVQAMPYKNENQTIDRPEIELQLKQVIEVAPQYESAVISPTSSLNPADGDTVDYGRQYADAIKESLAREGL